MLTYLNKLAGNVAPAQTNMTMDGFQVDIIFNSLKELQEEKGRNERVLAEECRKRKELETQLEEVNSEHKIAADKNSRMKEAMKVAEMKVAQIQAQVKMMEQVNNEKRERIRQLNQHTEQLEKQKAGQLCSFESQMNTLTEKFRTAWQDFGDKALDTAVDERDREMETLSTKVTANESLLQKLTSQLEQLKMKEQEKQQRAEEIPTATWQMVVGMFEVEKEASKTALERRKQTLEVEGLRKEKEELEKQLKELEKKLGRGSPHREE